MGNSGDYLILFNGMRSDVTTRFSTWLASCRWFFYVYLDMSSAMIVNSKSWFHLLLRCVADVAEKEVESRCSFYLIDIFIVFISRGNLNGRMILSISSFFIHPRRLASGFSYVFLDVFFFFIFFWFFIVCWRIYEVDWLRVI